MTKKPLINFTLGRVALLAAMAAVLFACPSPATAQSQAYWDATSPIDNSPGSGGTGNWDTTGGNTVWWVSGGSDSVWANGNIANFAGTAGTVTVDAPVTADGVTFVTTGYTLVGTNLTLSTNLTLLPTATITLPDNGTETINCPLTGTSQVSVSPTTSGPSILNLGGTNTYTNATTINPGTTLTISGSGSLNKGVYAGAITNNGAFTYISSALQTNSGTMTGSGSTIMVGGSGTLTITHANTGYTGSTTISNGSTMAFTTISAVGTATTITNNGTLNLLTGGAAQYSQAFYGSGVINFPIQYATASENCRFEGSVGLENYAGTVSVTTATSTGSTNNSSGLIGSGQLLVTLQTLQSPGTWNIGPGSTVAFPNTSTSSATVILDGPGNSQPYGALRLEGGANQTGNVLLNGNGITIGDDTIAPSPSVISGNMSDGGNNYGWAKAVGNPAIITTIILSGNNTYTGPTIFSSLGTLQVDSAETPGVSGPLGKSAYLNPGNIVFSAAYLQYSPANNYDYSGRFSTNAGQDYNIDVNGQSVTFATALTSSGSELTLKDSTGGGILTLSAVNTYAGITTISGGTLNVSGSLTESTAINVSGSGTLELSNSTALSSGTVLTLPSSPNGGSVELNFSGTQTILGLYFGGVQQPAGTYSATLNNSSGAFTGTGALNVQPQIFWDANGTDASSQSSANGGGNGSWDNTTSDWWITGSSDTTWVSNTIANFAGTAGIVTLNSNETASGLIFATDGYTVNGTSNLTLSGVPTIGLPNGGGAIVNCRIAGTGGLTESGSGTLTLGGSNTFTGPVAVASGCSLVIGGINAYAGATTIGSGSTVTITNAGDIGNGNYPGAIANGGTFNYSSTASQTLSGIISGSGPLTQTSGTLTLSGLNLYNAPITIGSGSTLAIGGNGDLNNNVTFNTGSYSGTLTDNGAFIYSSSAGQTIVSGISGTGSLTLGGGDTLTLTGGNSYAGVTVIGSNSTLIISGTGYLGAGDYETNITNNGTFTYDSAIAPQIVGGVISGSGALTIAGTGTLNLTSVNTYTGATTITTGTLALSGNGSIADSPSISIAAGATFDVSGLPSPYTLSGSNILKATGTAGLAAAINGAGGGIVNLGSQPVSLTFAPQTFNGDANDPALNIYGAGLTLNGNIISIKVSGGTPLGAGTYTLINVSSGTVSGNATPVISGAGLAANTVASLSDASGALNLVVSQAPSFTSFALSGGNLVLSGANGPDGGTYYVLTSTNLAVPLSGWANIATNTFSATGTFSVTNAVSVSPTFFVIEVAP